MARLMSPMLRAADWDQSWRDDAVCGEIVARDQRLQSLWFAPEDTTSCRAAVALCNACPVRVECLEWASQTKQRYGVWGGLPASVRLRHGRPHDFKRLVLLPDPYETRNRRSRFHTSRLTNWDGVEEEGDMNEEGDHGQE